MFILRDITDRKMLEAELGRSQDIYSIIVEKGNDGIIIVDQSFNVLYANEKMHEMIGFTHEEFRDLQESDGGTRWGLAEVIGAGDPEAVQELVDKFMKRLTGEAESGALIEITLGRRDGTVFPAEISTSMVEWGDGLADVIIVRDISERKASEEAVQEAEKRFKAVFNNELHMVYIYNELGRFIDANEYALKRLGYTLDEGRGIFFSDIIHPDDLEKTVLSTGEVMTKGYMDRPMEIRLYDRWGEQFWIECLSVTVEQDEHHFVGMGIAQDITERKRAEEKLLVYQAKLEGLVEKLKMAQDELSTPVIQVWNRILVLPLIGVLDTGRSQNVMDVLLSKIVEAQAEMVILDVTGVASMDTEVTNHLIRTVQSTSLLGAKCVVTGINPDVAQAMAQLGVDMSKLITKRDLQDGLKYGLRTMGYRIGIGE